MTSPEHPDDQLPFDVEPDDAPEPAPGEEER